jgi:predicted nucleic acid-binding protein
MSLRHFHAARWLDRFRNEVAIKLERVEVDLEAEAWEWLRAHDERPYSFVDATSFALMRKLRMGEALAFDGDFAATGFVELHP